MLRLEGITKSFGGKHAVDGVSLTVNEVADTSEGGVRFGVNVIPHTAQATTFVKPR